MNILKVGSKEFVVYLSSKAFIRFEKEVGGLDNLNKASFSHIIAMLQACLFEKNKFILVFSKIKNICNHYFPLLHRKSNTRYP